MSKSNLDNMPEINVVKRDGRVEPWDYAKMRNVAMWATGNSTYADILMKETEVKLTDNIKIADAFDNLIDTAKGKVSRIAPDWEYHAAKLHLLKMYSESVHGIKNKRYPHLKTVVRKGIKEGIYSSEITEKYSEDDLEYLNRVIDPTQDYTFTMNALTTFDSKYCKRLKDGTRLELPQMTYMRVAMGICWNLGSETHPLMRYKRIEIIEKLYWILTLGDATLATPIMNNSLTNLNSYASCILSTIGNSTGDLANALETAMLYTKGGGGVAFDISQVQAIGSITKNGVTSGGIVPHVRNLQSVIQSLMQSETRRGSGVVTCAWWHYEADTFLELKDASSGTEENRALHMKYSLASNDYFYKAIEQGKDIYLVDPLDTPLLNKLFGKAWEDQYEKYLSDPSIRRKTIPAKSKLMKKFLKYAFQTGNIYEILLDNVNATTMTNRYVGSSNLCQEILEPSRPGEIVAEVTLDLDGKPMTTKTTENHEVAICNLASFNMNILDRPKEEMDDVIYIVSLVLDNTIDIGSYMRSAGEYANKKYRYIGLGQNNTANYMARHKIKMDDVKAQDFTYLAFQKLHNSIVYANTEVAKERGANENMEGTKWAEGLLHYDNANEILKEKFQFLFDGKTAAMLKKKIKKDGIRNILMMATAPTASSANSKGLTEANNALHSLEYQLEGSVSGSVLAPQVRELGQYYSLVYETKPESMVILNCIRQLWIDQSQSFDIHLKEEHWNYKFMLKLKLLAWKLGMKTWYYTNTPKRELDPACVSCGT